MLGLPPPAPSSLPPAVKPPQKGFKRFNRKALAAILAVPLAAGAVLAYTAYERAATNARTWGSDEGADGAATGLVAPPSAQLVVARPPAAARPAAQQQKAETEKPDDLWEKFVKERRQKYLDNLGALWDWRYRQRLAALRDKLTPIAENRSGDTSASARETPLNPAVAPPQFAAAPTPPSLPGLSNLLGGSGTQDPVGQRQKEAFANQAGDSGQHDVLMADRKPPPGPYAVMSGSYIPAVAETEVNSDVPGLLVGRVAENITNTTDGACIIIPQSSKIIGRYDPEVTIGQERLPGVLTRIIFPDGSSLDLGAMEAAAANGAAGFEAEVDQHFWKRLGNGLIVGIAGLGNYVSQLLPFGGGGLVGGPASAVNSIGEMGLNIPPTLTVPPGTRFTVITGQDIAIRPWSCNGHRFRGPRVPPSLLTAD